MAINILDDELIPDAELAAEWNVTQRTLARYDSLGLKYIMVGARKYRPRKGSQEWLSARIRQRNPKRRAA